MMMNDNENYKNIVLGYCNRIITEKRMTIDENYQNGKCMYSIKFYQPEWFTELDDDLKHNIIVSIQNHFSQLVTNLINNSDNENVDTSRKRKHDEICCSSNCNCYSDSE